MSKKEKVAISALIGLGIGYVAGILTAPKSGKETRHDIYAAGVRTKAEAERRIKSLNSDLSDLISAAEEKFENAKASVRVGLGKAIDKAREAKSEARETLSSIHEGEVEDQDLKKAIADAQSAVDHLKSFLSK